LIEIYIFNFLKPIYYRQDEQLDESRLLVFAQLCGSALAKTQHGCKMRHRCCNCWGGIDDSVIG
jgi:hypothetical protein